MKPDLSEDEGSMFDQQEFVLRSTDDDFPAFPQSEDVPAEEEQGAIDGREDRDLRDSRSLSLQQLETVSTRSFRSVPSLDRDSRTNIERKPSMQRHSG